MSDYRELREAAEKAPQLNFKDCEVVRDGAGDYIECPHCDGGTVEAGGDYCNFDGAAIGVQFYGIGEEHVAAEAYLDAAKPTVIIGMIEEIETLRARVAELEAVELGILVRLYNTGYHQGHHDTVEGGYTHVYPADMDSYHDDVVSEWLDDQDDYTAPQPVKVPDEIGAGDALALYHIPDVTPQEIFAKGYNACREAMLAAQED